MKMKPQGVILTKKQEEILLDDIVRFGETHIANFVVFKVKERSIRKMKRLDGNKAGFALDGDKKEIVEYIATLVSRTLKERVWKK